MSDLKIPFLKTQEQSTQNDDKCTDVISQTKISKYFESTVFEIEGVKIITKEKQEQNCLKTQISTYSPTNTPLQQEQNLSSGFIELSTINPESLITKNNSTSSQTSNKHSVESKQQNFKKELKSSHLCNFERQLINQANFNATELNVPSEYNNICDNSKQVLKNLQFLKTEINAVLKTNPIIKEINHTVDGISSNMNSQFLELKQNIKSILSGDSSAGNPIQIKTVHSTITCDGCNVFPITGKRFKCLQCDDFDLCQKCEKTHPHLHPMIRLNETTDFFVSRNVKRIQILSAKNKQYNSQNDIRKNIVKKLTGNNYQEAFYEGILASNRNLQIGSFIDKVTGIFE